MSRSDDRELRVLLEDLDETLDALRRELDGDEDRDPTRQPPTVGELVRFTEEYTIPATIAALEAAIAALELLQGLLGVAARGDRALDDVSDAATGGVERTLSELRRALGESDLPDDPETRDVVREARDLTTAVERRIEESSRDSRTDSGVDIDVSEAETSREDPVESELRSIREELDDQDTT